MYRKANYIIEVNCITTEYLAASVLTIWDIFLTRELCDIFKVQLINKFILYALN